MREKIRMVKGRGRCMRERVNVYPVLKFTMSLVKKRHHKRTFSDCTEIWMGSWYIEGLFYYLLSTSRASFKNKAVSAKDAFYHIDLC